MASVPIKRHPPFPSVSCPSKSSSPGISYSQNQKAFPIPRLPWGYPPLPPPPPPLPCPCQLFGGGDKLAVPEFPQPTLTNPPPLPASLPLCVPVPLCVPLGLPRSLAILHLPGSPSPPPP